MSRKNGSGRCHFLVFGCGILETGRNLRMVDPITCRYRAACLLLPPSIVPPAQMPSPSPPHRQQQNMAARVEKEDRWDRDAPELLVGGLDISPIPAGGVCRPAVDGAASRRPLAPERAVAGLVVLRLPSLAHAYSVLEEVELPAPYRPGLLAFREGPACRRLLAHAAAAGALPQVPLLLLGGRADATAPAKWLPSAPLTPAAGAAGGRLRAAAPAPLRRGQPAGPGGGPAHHWRGKAPAGRGGSAGAPSAGAGGRRVGGLAAAGAAAAARGAGAGLELEQRLQLGVEPPRQRQQQRQLQRQWGGSRQQFGAGASAGGGRRASLAAVACAGWRAAGRGGLPPREPAAHLRQRGPPCRTAQRGGTGAALLPPPAARAAAPGGPAVARAGAAAAVRGGARRGRCRDRSKDVRSNSVCAPVEAQAGSGAEMKAVPPLVCRGPFRTAASLSLLSCHPAPRTARFALRPRPASRPRPG